MQILHPELALEVEKILSDLPAYSHGAKKRSTPNGYITEAFVETGWIKEHKEDFGTEKSHFIDLYKPRVAIEMEFSKFEMFFRDFFRFMLLYERRRIDAGIVITVNEMAYSRWQGEALAYKPSRASLEKLMDFLSGGYSSVVNVPIWCIGIE